MNSNQNPHAREDELALHNLSATYADAVNRMDSDSWINCWAKDASWRLMGNTANGRDNILALWQQMMAGLEHVLMLPSSGAVNINGNTATGHWYLQEVTRDKTGKAATVISRYADSYRKIDDHWYFQTREHQLMYIAETSATTQFFT